MPRTADEQAVIDRQRAEIAAATQTVVKDEGGEIVEAKAGEKTAEETAAEAAAVVVEAAKAEEAAAEAAKEAEENKEGEIEQHAKTEEELAAEKATAQTQKEKERIQKRIDKEVAKRKELEKELAEAKKQLAAKPVKDGEGLTEEEVERRSEAKAEQKATEREFVNSCNRLADAATKLDKEFKAKVDNMATEVAPIPGAMIGILDDLENGGAVLSYLTNNLDDYEEIYVLNPAKMGIRLARISDKILAEGKPKPKEISKVPPPMKPVGSAGGNVSVTITGQETQEEFNRKRLVQIQERAKQRQMGLRP